MWSRRRFLETASSLPVVGGVAAAGPGAAEAAQRKGADYFRDLGVRPFINAAGTYTAMTASLMPPEVLEAIQYAAKHFVMLDELHDKVGQRIASLLHCEAAMVTCGAASALTLGTAAVLTGKDPAEDRRPAQPRRHEERGDHPEVAPLRLRPRGAQLRREARRGRDRRRREQGGQREDGDDGLLQQQQLPRADPRRGVRRASARSTASPPSTTPRPTCRPSTTCGSTRRWASTW